MTWNRPCLHVLVRSTSHTALFANHAYVQKSIYVYTEDYCSFTDSGRLTLKFFSEMKECLCPRDNS